MIQKRKIVLILLVVLLFSVNGGCLKASAKLLDFNPRIEDKYLEVPVVILPLGVRMQPAISNPKPDASRSNAGLSDRELYLFAKMIECEARYEPYEGKVAVGAVILNRVKSSRFPNSIEKVIFQKGQFQPMTDGGWESKEPSGLAFKAAREALQGVKPVGDNGKSVGNALFFIYEELASETGSNWFRDNLKYITTIGNHDFYCY